MFHPTPIQGIADSQVAQFLLQTGKVFRNVVRSHHAYDHTLYKRQPGLIPRLGFDLWSGYFQEDALHGLRHFLAVYFAVDSLNKSSFGRRATYHAAPLNGQSLPDSWRAVCTKGLQRTDARQRFDNGRTQA